METTEPVSTFNLRTVRLNAEEHFERQAGGASLLAGDRQYQSLGGLETWFALPGSKAIVPNPRCKMVIKSKLGRSRAVATLMTCLFVPWLTWLFRSWLVPQTVAVSK